jgi:hypothetical protein
MIVRWEAVGPKTCISACALLREIIKLSGLEPVLESAPKFLEKAGSPFWVRDSESEI